MNNPAVNIIICTFNNLDIIRNCINSVVSSDYKNYNIIVVDDNSSDGTVDYIKKEYPFIKVIENKKNQGPSINRNIAINLTKEKYIVTLDSDIKLTPFWLTNIINFMEKNPDIDICGGKLLFPDGRINAVGGGMKKSRVCYSRMVGKIDNGSFNKKEEVFYVCSAAMIVRRSLLNDIGLFDEKYFYGYEEADLCWRANICGKKVVYFPKVKAYHNVGLTVSKLGDKIKFHGIKNIIRCILKNYELKNILIYLPQLFVFTTGGMVLHRKFIKATLGAWLWNIFNLKSTLKLRKEVQQLRKIRDKDLFNKFIK